MKVYSFLLSLILLVLVQSCALNAIDSDYHFGDVTRAAIDDLRAYCEATTEEQRAAARLAFMTVTQTPFPANPCALYERLKGADGDVVQGQVDGFSKIKVLPASASSTATKHAEFS